jgi:hypothetical protein
LVVGLLVAEGGRAKDRMEAGELVASVQIARIARKVKWGLWHILQTPFLLLSMFRE